MIQMLPPISSLSVDVMSSGANSQTGASSLFKDSLKVLDSKVKESSSLKKSYQLGDPNVTLPEVMMASQTSGIAMSFAIEIRNKSLEAYKEIINMPV
jgi:flagellar hook-basal body complex protein FliE